MGPDTRCFGPLPRHLNATDRNDPEVPLHASYRVHPEPEVSLLERARRSVEALRRREAELYERREESAQQRYPVLRPPDFDGGDAGERWDPE